MSSRNSLNTRGILATIHFFQFIQGLLYLFTPKRDRGEREEEAISSPFIGKEFRDIALLKFSLSKLLITGFLISTNSAGNKHLFIENRQQRILHLFNDLSPETLSKRNPSRSSAHPREIIIAGQVTLGPSNPVIFLTKNRPSLDGASPRSDIQ